MADGEWIEGPEAGRELYDQYHLHRSAPHGRKASHERGIGLDCEFILKLQTAMGVWRRKKRLPSRISRRSFMKGS